MSDQEKNDLMNARWIRKIKNHITLVLKQCQVQPLNDIFFHNLE